MRRHHLSPSARLHLLFGAVILPFAIATAKDEKNEKSNTPEPPHPPELACYWIDSNTSPHPGTAEPVETTLPLVLQPADRVCYVGNTLLDRTALFGHFEALVQTAFPDANATQKGGECDQ